MQSLTPPPVASDASRFAPPERFTLDGSPALEDHLARICVRIANAVRGLIPPTRLDAIFLGGGYGRGEGGVLDTSEGQRPYNDLEFYVFIRGNRHLAEWRYARALDVLGEILTPAAGAHVEFKLAARTELERQPISMFSYDLVSGHRQLHGDPNYFRDCGRHRRAGELPVDEATRLLMNRCSGLLLSRDKLDAPDFTAADADFVGRNLAKAALALGDAVLTVRNRYHWSCRERHERLIQDLRLGDAPTWSHEIIRLHADGVAFKLHPERSSASRAALRQRYDALLTTACAVWLWVEERRTGHHFSDARAYALDPRRKFPAARLNRATFAQLKQGGWTTLLSGEPLKPPRERLLRAMALLLWAPTALHEPRLLMRLQRELQTDAVALPAFVRAYSRLWSRIA